MLGEGDLSEIDKKYIEFGNEFENKFINQIGRRDINQTLDLALKCLKILPEEEMDKL